MDDQRFDQLPRTISRAGINRRSLLPGLIGGALAAVLGQAVEDTAAAKCAAPGKKCTR